MRRKSLNGRLVAVLAVVASVGSIALYALHAVQVGRTATTLRAQAEKAEQAGRADDALEYLERYLAYRPTDAEALVRFGAILRRSGGPAARRRATDAYEKAVRLAPDRPEPRRKLVDFLIEDGNLPDARVHLEALTRQTPDDPTLPWLLGQCEEEAGRYREAADQFERARVAQPTRIEVYVRLANLLRRRLNDPARADAVMDAVEEKAGVVATNSGSAAAYLARAAYRETYGIQVATTDGDVDRARELAPSDADVLMRSARAALRRGDGPAARRYLEDCVAKHPALAGPYRILADLLQGTNQREQAADWLRRGIAAVPQDQVNERTMLRWTLADVLIQGGGSDEANTILAALGAEKVRPELLDLLRGANLVARGQVAEAARILTRLDPILAADASTRVLAKRALLLLTFCHDQMGNPDLRLDAARRAAGIDVTPDPYRDAARLALAEALAAAGRPDEAIDELRKVPENPTATLAEARLRVLQALGQPAESGRWAAATRSLDLAGARLAGQPGEAAVAALRAQVMAAQGQVDQARSLLGKAVADHPEQGEAWLALADLAGRGGQIDARLAVLDEAGRKGGARAVLLVARANCWAEKGGPAAPAALAQVERDSARFAGLERATVERGLALAQARIGKPAEAARLWSAVAAARPDHMIARLALFNLALEAGDRDRAGQALDQLLRIEGEDGPTWRFCRALLQLDRGRGRGQADGRALLAGARSDLDRVAQLRPSWSRVPLALAEVDLVEGNPDAAIGDYLHAIVDLGDRTPGAISRLAQLLGQRQRYSEAELLLSKLRGDAREAQIKPAGVLDLLASQVAFRNQDYEGALKQAGRAISEDSNDARDLLWLGRLREAAGKPAEPVLRRAVTVARDLPDARVALIESLTRAGRKADAEAALAQAEAELPRDAAALALARANEVVGRPDRAAEYYRDALTVHPDDPRALRAVAVSHLRNGRVADAEALLRRIIERGAAADEVPWARRTLATVVAGRGRPLDTNQALAILGSGTNGAAPGPAGDAPEDQRARALILSRQPGRDHRREAIAILERLIERQFARPADYLLLAELNEVDGDWSRARQRLAELVDRGGVAPVQLAAAARALLRHGQQAEAEALLARLEAQAKGQPITLEVQARVLQAAGRGDQAGSLLEGFARSNPANLVAVSALCEELQQYDVAERLLRSNLDQAGTRGSVASLDLARLLGRRGRAREAVDLLDSRAWPALPAPKVATAAVSVLTGDLSGDPALRDRVAGSIDRAARNGQAADNDRAMLRFDLANVRCLQGRYDEAEQILRELAVRSELKVATLNNLAWMKALLQGNQAAQSLSLIDQAIALAGEISDLLDTRGVVHLALGQAELATRDLEDAISTGPGPDKYFHLAQAYLAVGKRSDAERAFHQAEALGLSERSLHPLEQPAYRDLAGKVARH